MGPDGIVQESDLLDAMDGLIDRQQSAQDQGAVDGTAVDILSLSMGFYSEDPETPGYGSLLQERLDTLRSMGVTVVAASGNDSTTIPFLPAALCSYNAGSFVLPPVVSTIVASRTPIRPEQWSPLISVGALNPSQSVALFSNGGGWVSCHAPGALLVSTTPLRDSSAQPGFAIGDGPTPGGWRSSVDPDFFTGWGTWSGHVLRGTDPGRMPRPASGRRGTGQRGRRKHVPARHRGRIDARLPGGVAGAELATTCELIFTART